MVYDHEAVHAVQARPAVPTETIFDKIEKLLSERAAHLSDIEESIKFHKNAVAAIDAELGDIANLLAKWEEMRRMQG